MNIYNEEITNNLNKFDLNNKILKYWLNKLFVSSYHKKNQIVGGEKSLGIILEGQFKIDKYISIMNINKNLSFMGKFQLCLLGPTEVF